MTPAPAPDRRYKGSTADERRARRREQFIMAAVEVYGERGYRQATVKSVCDAAGLTERYFYESFPNSEALLIASFRAVTDHLFEGVARAGAASDHADGYERVRAMLTAYYEGLKRSPAPARVFLVEISGVSAEMDRELQNSLSDLGGLIEQTLYPGKAAERPSDELLMMGIVGGIIHIALQWIGQGYVRPVSEVAATALRLCRVLEHEPRLRIA